MEQEEYTKEEINWSYIEFVDNQDVLDLIEKVPVLLFHFSGDIIVCIKKIPTRHLVWFENTWSMMPLDFYWFTQGLADGPPNFGGLL